MAIPLLETIDIQGKVITADALHTQRRFASYLVEQRQAHYYFTVKGNQPSLLEDITFYFQQNPSKPNYIDLAPLDHGRIETRKIWTSTALNAYLNFPYVEQIFAIEREFINKKSGQSSTEIAYGVTSCSNQQADAEKILNTVRSHWCIENSCHYIIDWIYDEDRCRIRTGYGPQNITRLRRFAVGLIKSKGVYSVAQKMRTLSFNVRAVFDYLKMTQNAQATGFA